MSDKKQWLKDLCREDDLWATEFSEIPSMIKSLYDNLRRLAEDGQVYGVMLQCKVLYEALHKVPIIMTLTIIENDSKYKEGKEYASIINEALKEPMSMGQWNKLASVIIKAGTQLALPEKLIKILKRTVRLYGVKLGNSGVDVMKWRNTEVGHGALRFEDDGLYQIEIRSLLKMLKVYFDGPGRYCIKGLYSDIYLTLDGENLVGEVDVQHIESSDLVLHVDSESYKAKYYIERKDLRFSLFDSFYGRKRIVKYCSYADGWNEETRSQYFDVLYDKFVINAHEDFELNSAITSRKQAAILECLSAPLMYIEPEELVNLLSEAMEDLEKGVIAVFMERGTGKSAFANQMSGLYNASPLITNSLSRCYHIRDASLKGVNDFINSVEFNYRHSFHPEDDVYAFSDKAPTLSLDSVTPAEDMAKFLNFYHSKYEKEYTILLIDGIDEITDQTAKIMDYVPPADLLDEGVFVVLLSRFKDESTVIGGSKQYIETAEKKSQKQIGIRRTDQSNIDVLKTCLENEIRAGRLSADIILNDLIVKADYRFLYLKAFIGINADILLNTSDENKFIESYMNYILSFYGPSHINKLKEIAVSIALFPSITIRNYHEYLSADPITYEFIGLLNDLLPILTVLHSDDGEYYEYADEAYSEYVLEEYKDVVEKRIETFFLFMKDFLELNLPENLNSIDPMDTTINEAFIFYVEGFIGLWNQSNRKTYIRSLFFSNTEIMELVVGLCFDEWATSGRGFYIFSELLNCIYSALNYCVRNPEDTEAMKWSKSISSRMANLLYEDRPFVPISTNYIWESEGIKKLFRSIIQNQEAVKDIDTWFWVLAANKTEETIQLLVKKNAVKDFIDFIHKYCHPLWFCKRIEDWFGILSEAEISNGDKQRIIGIQNEITEYIEKEYEETTEYINAQKRYEEETDHQIISKTINDLLDFEIPWSELNETETGIYLSILLSRRESKSREYMDFMSAFYKRLCFENNIGRPEEVLYSIRIENYKFLFDVLRIEFTDDQQFIYSLRWWIGRIIQLVNDGNVKLLGQITELFYCGIKWLDSKGRNTEALAMLEDYVYCVETEAFLREVKRASRDNVKISIMSHGCSLLYPTDNVIYLLNRYYTEGMHENFSSLMSKVENDIPLIVKEAGNYRAENATYEFRLFDFIRYRRSIKYSSDFDNYLNDKVNAHIREIQKELDKISRNSDFGNIEFHIELLMEYAWRTNEWNEGCKLCDELIELFKENECTDIIVRQSMKLEMKRVHSCKLFFSYLRNGVLIEEEHDAASIPQSAYQFKTFGRTVYDAIQSFLGDSKPKSREEYTYDTEISLRFYPQQ